MSSKSLIVRSRLTVAVDAVSCRVRVFPARAPRPNEPKTRRATVIPRISEPIRPRLSRPPDLIAMQVLLVPWSCDPYSTPRAPADSASVYRVARPGETGRRRETREGRGAQGRRVPLGVRGKLGSGRPGWVAESLAISR